MRIYCHLTFQLNVKLLNTNADAIFLQPEPVRDGGERAGGGAGAGGKAGGCRASGRFGGEKGGSVGFGCWHSSSQSVDSIVAVSP